MVFCHTFLGQTKLLEQREAKELSSLAEPEEIKRGGEGQSEDRPSWGGGGGGH